MPTTGKPEIQRKMLIVDAAKTKWSNETYIISATSELQILHCRVSDRLWMIDFYDHRTCDVKIIEEIMRNMETYQLSAFTVFGRQGMHETVNLMWRMGL
jgi:hypothetical protein